MLFLSLWGSADQRLHHPGRVHLPESPQRRKPGEWDPPDDRPSPSRCFAHFVPSSCPQITNESLPGIDLMIAIGVIIMVLGFLGCCGAIRENRCMLLLVRNVKTQSESEEAQLIGRRHGVPFNL